MNEPTGQADASAVAALARTAMANALAASDPADKLRWLDRAHRLIPDDPNTTLMLAGACLATDANRAAMLFLAVLSQHDVRQAWLGLTVAHLRNGEPDKAVRSLAAALSRHAFAPDTRSLAEQMGGAAGWCALRSDGGLEIHGAARRTVSVLLDGKPVRGAALPAGWERARTLSIRRGERPLPGSPIDIAAIRRLFGCVEVWQGGLRGWAWHPSDPQTPPVLSLTGPGGGAPITVVATETSGGVLDTGPLALPRSFQMTRDQLASAAPGPIHVRGPDGLDLPGSPLDPFADEAGQGGFSSAPRAGGPFADWAEGTDDLSRSATIVIPVHNGGDIVQACLSSVIASVPNQISIVVVDDGTSDPAVIAVLDDLEQKHAIRRIRHPAPLGFPAAANAGIAAVADGDVVLLNSDTLVPPGWLERLQAAAWSGPDIGTVTPFSNEASILSYPGASGTNPPPDQTATNRLDRLVHRANGGDVTDIPVGVGFCLYLRRDCLTATGLFRADIFAQGYGEENDFCLRARLLGWRNVALTGLFVGHHGGASFNGTARHLRRRNGRIIEDLHPGHDALIARFVADDPLADARRRIDLLDWRERGRTWRQAAILITHASGGGVEHQVRHAAAEHARNGRRPIILRPAETAAGEPAITVREGLTNDVPNLVFAMPRELPVLLRLLRATKPDRIEAHHLADYPAAIYELITRLGVPYEVHVHDYAWFCPRISLVGGHGRYCGEPDLHGCETCVAGSGGFLKEEISVAALRTRSAAFLSSARRVVTPSDDTGRRLRRHFDGLATTTIPHEDDASIPPADPGMTAGRARPSFRARVCVVGAIGAHKGYEILLACARDAARRDLDLEFIVVGHTIDDAALMATGRIFVTGRFEPGEALDLIAAQNASIGFVASIWPETWCLTLSDLWRAGLTVAAFDIGAPAERIRQTGRGILLPLALPASAINNALIAAIRAPGH